MCTTLNKKFQDSVKRFGSRKALLYKREGKYRHLTYHELAQKVKIFAKGLLRLGVKKKDRVALISENRPEWAITDLALIHIGAINVALFPTLPIRQVEYVVKDCDAEIVIVSGKSHLEKALALKQSIPKLRTITMDCEAEPSRDVMSFERVYELGRQSKIPDSEFENLWQSVKPDDWATIIYTSGTTGLPKGAILTHKNFVSNVEACIERIPFRPSEVILSFLPLNHVLPRMADHYTPLTCGATIAYVEDLAKLRENACEVRPHYVTLVPRVLEMIKDRLEMALAKESETKRKMFHRALEVGKSRLDLLQKGRRVPFALRLKFWLMNRLVFSKVRKKLGMQRLKYFISGGAPLPKAVNEFFASMGLQILEGYGLTETSPVVTVNPPSKIKIGTVGPPISGVEVRIADDGEILVRGDNVMLGYYKKEDETRKTIDEDGWLHTGDVGQIDEDGYLKITDRKKDIIVLASGKKVAPQPIENRLTESPYISQVVLVGDKKTTIGALIVPNFDNIREWAKLHCINIPLEDERKLVASKEVHSLIRNEIDRLSEGLAPFEKIHRFRLICEEFSIEHGELTPTLKIKRGVVYQKFAEIIRQMYE